MSLLIGMSVIGAEAILAQSQQPSRPDYYEMAGPSFQITSLLSKLAGIRSGDQVIYWEIGRDQGGAEIRLPGSAVPISQDPAPPARR